MVEIQWDEGDCDNEGLIVFWSLTVSEIRM